MAAIVPKVENVVDFKGFPKLVKRKKDGKFGESIAWEYDIWEEFSKNVKTSILGNQNGREIWKLMTGTAMVGVPPAMTATVNPIEAPGFEVSYPNGITAENEMKAPVAPLIGVIPKKTTDREAALIRIQAEMTEYLSNMVLYQAQQAAIQKHRLEITLASAIQRVSGAGNAAPVVSAPITYYDVSSPIGYVLSNVEAKYVLAIIKVLSEEIKNNSRIEKLVDKMENTGLRQLWKALEELYSTDNDNGRVALDVMWSKVSVETCEGDLLKFLKKLKELIKRYQNLTIYGRSMVMDESLINMKLNSELTYDKCKSGHELREKADDAEDAAGGSRSKGLVRIKIMIDKLKRVRERDEHRVDGERGPKKRHPTGLNLHKVVKGDLTPEVSKGKKTERVNEHAATTRGGASVRGRGGLTRGNARGRGGLGDTTSAVRERAPTKLTAQSKNHCYHHLKEPGSCPFGDECRFEHLDEHEVYGDNNKKDPRKQQEAKHPAKDSKKVLRGFPAVKTENFCSFCGGRHPLKDCRAKLIDPKKAFSQSRGKERTAELSSHNANKRRATMLAEEQDEEVSSDDNDKPKWAKNAYSMNIMEAAFYVMSVQAAMPEFTASFGSDANEWHSELQAHVAELEGDINRRMLYDSGATMSFSSSSRGGYNTREVKVAIKVGGGKVYLADKMCTKMVPCFVHGKLMGFREIDFVIWDKCKGDIVCSRDLAQGRRIIQDEFAFKVILPNGMEQMHGYYDNEAGLYYLPGTAEYAEEMIARLGDDQGAIFSH